MVTGNPKGYMQRITNHKSKIINLLWWAFASLVAIVLLQTNPLLGLAVAVAGGIVFGILLFVK
jgi:hypothetical protein